MIVKPYTPQTATSNRRAQAGAEAESQMAHYLHRHFADDTEVHVLHDLRLRDPEQPEQTGDAGTCQIDHLLIHRWGMFIVESKSVISEVRVRPDGSGGDEWTRMWNGAEKGMPSPIRQAKRQGEFLRTYLRRQDERLLGSFPSECEHSRKATIGSDQRGFRNLPVQLVVAISDSGRIQRLDGWHEPKKPFRVFVTKADAVAEKIADELKRHRKGANPLKNPLATGGYGLWWMKRRRGSRRGDVPRRTPRRGTAIARGNATKCRDEREHR